jgi:hypothetical protein
MLAIKFAAGCTDCMQVEVVLHAPGAPSNTRTLQLTRQKVTINPVTFTTCSNVAAAALPAGMVRHVLWR